MTPVPSPDHPIWPLLQKALSLLGLIIVAYHGVEGSHQGLTPDTTDAVGGAIILKEIGHFLKNRGRPS